MKDLKHTIFQFIKFNLVGLLNTAVDFAIYTLLTEVFGVVYFVAKTLSYTAGVLNSFFFNSRWTFRGEGKGTGKQFMLFVAVNLVSLGVSLGGMYLCKNALGITSDFWSNLIVTPVAMVVNFIGNKLFVFKADGTKGGRTQE
ncbi:MAG: GtrA family protein [Bacillota bacterium]